MLACVMTSKEYIYIYISLYFTAAHGWDIHELFIIFQVKYEGETDLYDLTREELMADYRYKDGSLTCLKIDKSQRMHYKIWKGR
jgi:hypothetical protein